MRYETTNNGDMLAMDKCTYLLIRELTLLSRLRDAPSSPDSRIDPLQRATVRMKLLILGLQL